VKRLSFSDKTVLYLGGNIAQSLLSLAQGIILVRLLNRHDYGTFQQVMLLTSAIASIAAMSLHQSLYYFIPKADGKARGIISQTFSSLLLMGVISGGMVYLLRGRLGVGFNNPDLARLAGVFCLFLMSGIPGKVTDVTLISSGRIVSAAVLTVATSTAMLLLTSLPIVLGYGLRLMLICVVAYYLTYFLLAVILIVRTPGGGPSLGLMKTQLIHCLPLALAGAVGMFRSKLDKFIISFFYPPARFAVYSRGAFELPLVAILPWALGNLLIPRFTALHARKDRAGMMALWRTAIRRVALIFFPIFAFSFIFADNLIALLYTESYAEGASVFRIYLCLLPFRLISYRSILQAVGDTRPIFVSTVVGLSVNAALTIALLKTVGFIGPAIAFVCSELVSMGYILSRAGKALNLPFPSLLPWRRMGKLFGIAGLAGAGVYPIKLAGLSEGLTLLIACSAFAPLYLAMITRSKLLEESDRALIKRWGSLSVLLKGLRRSGGEA